MTCQGNIQQIIYQRHHAVDGGAGIKVKKKVIIFTAKKTLGLRLSCYEMRTVHKTYNMLLEHMFYWGPSD